jgi:hypothetical protein
MPIVLNGTSGITTPTVQTGGIATNLYPLVSGTAQASTSGTSINFTDIPNWVKRITFMLNGVSTNSTSGLLLRVGTSSGIVSTGYIATSVTSNSIGETSGQNGTTGFNWYNDTAALTHYGAFTLYLFNTSTYEWVCTHTGRLLSTNSVSGGGNVILSGPLDRLQLTTVSGTATFDAGTVNIMYE